MLNNNKIVIFIPRVRLKPRANGRNIFGGCRVRLHLAQSYNVQTDATLSANNSPTLLGIVASVCT